jgi:hypothetical protein
MTQRKYFSHPSLVIYFFAIPSMKVKLGRQTGGGLLNSKQPETIIMMSK